MTALSWTMLLFANSLSGPAMLDGTLGNQTAPPERPGPQRVQRTMETPSYRPFEVGAQFGGMRILDNPVASSSLYVGGRASYRLPYQIVAGVVAQYDDFSSRTSTGSDFSFWATRGELGYELSHDEILSVLPYVELGYANTKALLCTESHNCSRMLSSGGVGAVGLRFATLGDWFYSGLEVNYQFGQVDTLFFGVSGGFRI